MLSFDGGPSATFNVRIIQRIEETIRANPEHYAGKLGFLDSVDLYVGVSNGAIAALSLARRELGTDPVFEVSRTVDLVLEAMAQLKPRKRDILRMVAGLGPILRSGPFRKALEERFSRPDGSPMQLRDLHGHVLVGSYDVARGRPKVWSNLDIETAVEGAPPRPEADLDVDAVEVAMASGALPLYLPVHHGQLDGAIFANNPAVAAVFGVMGAQEKLQAEQAAGIGRRAAWKERLQYATLPDEVVCLSFGGADMSAPPEDVARMRADEGLWGWPQWMFAWKDPLKLASVFIQGSGTGTDFQGRQLLGERYFRWVAANPQGRSLISGLLDLFLRDRIGIQRMTETLADDASDVDFGTDGADRSFQDLMDWVHKWWLKDDDNAVVAPLIHPWASYDIQSLLEAQWQDHKDDLRRALRDELGRRRVRVRVRVEARQDKLNIVGGDQVYVRLTHPGRDVARSHMELQAQAGQLVTFSIPARPLVGAKILDEPIRVLVLEADPFKRDDVVAEFYWQYPYEPAEFEGKGAGGHYVCSVGFMDEDPNTMPSQSAIVAVPDDPIDSPKSDPPTE